MDSRSYTKNRHPLDPFKSRLSTFGLWGTLVGIVFFSIYPTTNWLTSLGDRHYSLFLNDELHLPFIPEFIWLYLSMYVLFAFPPFFLNSIELRRLAKELILSTFIAGVTFLIIPARLGFTRTLPGEYLYRQIFEHLFTVDNPYNLVPSLHVIYSVAITLSLAGRTIRPVRVTLFVWLTLIVISTIFVHQHHILDVLTGVALAIIVRLYWENKNV